MTIQYYIGPIEEFNFTSRHMLIKKRRMCQHSGTLEPKWYRQFTRPKCSVAELGLGTRLQSRGTKSAKKASKLGAINYMYLPIQTLCMHRIIIVILKKYVIIPHIHLKRKITEVNNYENNLSA